MLTPSSQPEPSQQPGRVPVDQPTDDAWTDEIWNMGLPSEQAALDALRWHWDEAYDIGVEDGQWWYRRKDGIGGIETAATPDGLRAQIIMDYTVLPVRRGLPSSGGGVP
jgi:hypothetical protein